MADLFSPLSLAGLRLANRIVMAPAPSGLAGRDGFGHAALAGYYERRAHAGVGLIISEPVAVCPPLAGVAHLGLYSDAFIPALRRIAAAAHAHGARLLLALEAPAAAAQGEIGDLRALAEQFVAAVWRAHAAGADGVSLSIADGGALAQLVSPRLSRRADAYGGSIDGRLRLTLEIIEASRRWLGRRTIIALRMPAEELVPGGLSHQDARVIARRAVAAGAQMLDVTVTTFAAEVARFPGWTIPLAASIRRIASEVPVIGSGILGDPQLADAVIRDGSVDLVMLGAALRTLPEWPRLARRELGG